VLRGALSNIAWIGRTASMVFGLALVLALVFGVATMAFGANGDFFKVGRSNLASAVSTLTKSGAGPALSLKVDSGAPLAVNSSHKVSNLNSDKLDGMEPSQLPGSVATTKGFAGKLGEIKPTPNGLWLLFGPTVEVTTTSNQRLVGSADATITGSGKVGFFGGLLFDYGLCYYPVDQPLFARNFVGADYTQATTIDSSETGGDVFMSYSPSATVVPGEGTWVVGFCARNPTDKTIQGGHVNGWVQVVNQ
jgi:hypothetical protein